MHLPARRARDDFKVHRATLPRSLVSRFTRRLTASCGACSNFSVPNHHCDRDHEEYQGEIGGEGRCKNKSLTNKEEEVHVTVHPVAL